jgi:hypothetical protein
VSPLNVYVKSVPRVGRTLLALGASKAAWDPVSMPYGHSAPRGAADYLWADDSRRGAIALSVQV